MFLAGGVPTSKPKASAKREPRKVPPARGRWGLQHLVPGRGARHGSLGKPDLDEFGHFTAVDVQPHVPAALRRAESVLSRVEVPARVGLEFTGTGHTSGYSSSTLVPRGLAGSGQRVPGNGVVLGSPLRTGSWRPHLLFGLVQALVSWQGEPA